MTNTNELKSFDEIVGMVPTATEPPVPVSDKPVGNMEVLPPPLKPGEIRVKTDDLRKAKLFLATPMYGGQCFGLYMKSALDLQGLAAKYGIECRYSFLFNESLITRARNYLVDEFLRSDYTHMVFIDADIGFDANDVITMLALSLTQPDKDIIGAPYPKKSINWKNIITAVKRDPNISPENLSGLIGDYVFNVVKGSASQFQVTDPLEVMEVGTGFMMIRREVFEKFKAAYPDRTYLPDHRGTVNFDGSRPIHAYFDCVIDPETKRYLSEDYMFCQYARAAGMRVWLCPWMKTTHIGTYPFTGDMLKIAQHLGHLN